LAFGFNDNAVRSGRIDVVQDAALTAAAGADITRLTFDWRWVEPQPGVQWFDEYDQIYGAMLARGVRPVLILMLAPWWTWDPTVGCNQWAQDCRYPPGPAHYADWGRMAAQLAARYPEAAAIEVWNEPNISGFWQPRPDPVRYTQLLREAYLAVKRVNPRMPVVSGGVTNDDQTSPDRISLADFTRAVYANGGKDYMDGLAFHPYSRSAGAGSQFERDFATVRSVRDAFGDSRKPLWVTEVGLSTTGSDPGLSVTPEEQATALRAMYRAVAAMPDVKAMIVHELLDSGADPGNLESGFGVLRGDLSAKPAFWALSEERGPGAFGPGAPSP
jgi:polysaccharide biosynthesis protein PslG